MVQIDLVTGFLGSGKTTFIKKYATYLVSQGLKVGIIENDFGAVNIDRVLLQDLEGEHCEIEQIVGGNVESDWKRRFKAKLIAMAMQGFNRVVVEPSGIYDVDVFFDVLYDEPVNRWFEPGSIFAIVDEKLDENLSKQAKYLLTSQVANAGLVVLSKINDETSEQDIEETITRLQQIVQEFQCDRQFSKDSDVLAKKWDTLEEQDYQRMMNCRWKKADHEKLWFDHNDAFTSLFFMEVKMKKEEVQNKIEQLMQDETCGTILRVKGFILQDNQKWLEINATQEQFSMKEIDQAQEVMIVIGENLVEERIKAYL